MYSKINSVFWLAVIALITLPLSAHATQTKIEGYTNALSFAPGEKVTFHVSTTAPNYSIRITRSGVVEEIVWEKSGIPGKNHPVPERAWENGPGWPESLSLKIPADWRSGYYIITFMTYGVAGQRDQSEHFFEIQAKTQRL